MRYCYGDYEKEEEILKNINAEKIFNKEDIWDNNIYNAPKYQEEIKKLIDFNNNGKDNLEQYFLVLIFKGEEEEEEEEEEKEKEDDNKSKKSDDSGRSKGSKGSKSSGKSDEKDKNNNSDSEKEDDNKSDD